MENSPNFDFNPNDFDPEIGELLAGLNESMDAENQKHLDSLRNSYYAQLQYRDKILQKGIGQQGMANLMTAEFEKKVQTYFLYYLDGIFKRAPLNERVDQIAEVLYETDGSQKSVNQYVDGSEYSIDASEIRGQVAAMLLDDDREAKGHIERFYDQKFSEKVRRVLFD